MPRLRHGAPAQHGQRHRQVHPAVEPAQKKSRLVQIGSSPPPFTTASHLIATRDPRYRHDQPEPARAASPSPKAKRQRRIVLVQRNNALDLRSSWRASPSHFQETAARSAAPVATASRGEAASNVDSAHQSPRRELLQRNPQLDWSTTSSPIGTFGGNVIGRSGRRLCSSHTGAPDQASRATRARTVGLPSLHRSSHLQAGPRGRQSTAPTPETTNTHNENAVAPPLQQAHRGEKSTKRPTDELLVRPRRRRAKIQRVQLGGGLPSSSADQPLSDADHHVNSQPDAADGLDGADESEISYFPTLRPARPSGDATRIDSDGSDDHAISALQHDAVEHPFLSIGPTVSIAIAEAKTKAADPQDGTVERADDQPEDGDSSAGLLEVLSQSAMRKLSEVQAAPAVSALHTQQGLNHADVAAEDAPSPAEAQHRVQVDFDATCFTDSQAERIASWIVTSKTGSKRWSSVHPDSAAIRNGPSKIHSSSSQRVLRAAFQPPSTGAVCRDLGLSVSQVQKRPMADVPDFVHHRPCGFDDGLQSDDEESLEPFEHGLRFAGYRQARTQSELTAFPLLQPFKELAFQQRRQARRKEVVKIIVPFSEPSLSAHATRARFVTPCPASIRPEHRPRTRSDDDTVTLVWTQSTAHSFFRALETLLQAGFAPSAQHSSTSHRVDSVESDLYPSPILHYAAHAAHDKQTKAPSHVALFVHLDRLEEARRTLARFELGEGAEGSYRPFSDLGVHLLVTSLRGEPLCLI